MDVTFWALVSNGQTDLQKDGWADGQMDGHKYRQCGSLVDPILFETEKMVSDVVRSLLYKDLR